MKFKTFIMAALAAVGIGLSAQAAQPVVYTMVLTNASIPVVAVSSNLTVTLGGVLFSNTAGTAVEANALDTLLQSQVSAQFDVWPTTTTATPPPNLLGVYTLTTVVSPDGVVWNTGPTFSAGYVGTNQWQGVLTNFSIPSWRYIAPQTFTTTVTNLFLTNNVGSALWTNSVTGMVNTNAQPGWTFKVMFKGS